MAAIFCCKLGLLVDNFYKNMGLIDGEAFRNLMKEVFWFLIRPYDFA